MDVWTTLLLIQTVMNSKEIYHSLAGFTHGLLFL